MGDHHNVKIQYYKLITSWVTDLQQVIVLHYGHIIFKWDLLIGAYIQVGLTLQWKCYLTTVSCLSVKRNVKCFTIPTSPLKHVWICYMCGHVYFCKGIATVELTVIEPKGGVHICKLANGDLTWENLKWPQMLYPIVYYYYRSLHTICYMVL